MLITDQMKGTAASLRDDCERMRAELGLLQAWSKLQMTMMWDSISTNLGQLETFAMDTCIARGTSDTAWRESAAEARVYRWLRRRPESVKPEIERITVDLAKREAEIKRLEGLTKGV